MLNEHRIRMNASNQRLLSGSYALQSVKHSPFRDPNLATPYGVFAIAHRKTRNMLSFFAHRAHGTFVANIRAMHLSQLRKTIEHGEFSLSFVAKGGDVVRVSSCVLTSWYTLGNTLNVMLIGSREVRTINKYTIILINNQELFL